METPLYQTVRPLLTGLFKLIYRPTYVGLENIPKEGRVVLAGNHTHFFDCILIISSNKRVVHFLAKHTLLKGPFKWMFKGMGIIQVNRTIKDASVIKNSEKALNEEKMICVFPEGTINETEDIIMPFKMGAVKMTSETNAPIVPFAITGKFKPFQKSIKIEFMKPMKPSKDLEKQNKLLEERVARKLEQSE